MTECTNQYGLCDKNCPGWKACIAENLEARKNYDDDGVARLIHGVLKRAIKDWANACTPDSRQRAETFFLSHYFGSLTGLDGKTFLEKLKKQKEEQKQRKAVKRDALHR